MQRIYCSDFFGVSSDLLEEEGLFNISLLNDLPLFIDPFLIFCIVLIDARANKVQASKAM